MSAAPPEVQKIVALMRSGAWPEALRMIDARLAGKPADARHLIYRAQCLMALRRRSEARAAAAAAEAFAPADAFVRNAAGSVYSYANDHERALQSYDAAIAQDPRNAQCLYNRAAVRRFLGDLEGAEQDYDRVIALRPTDYEAYKNRSDLRSQSAQRNHIPELRALLAAPIADWRGEVQLRYALAKEYEDAGAYAESFEMLRQGANTQRRHMRYEVTTDLSTVQWIMEAFPTLAVSEQTPAGPADSPIFVLGLPRSGSTLVERILTSHTALGAAGELDSFALALVAAVKQRTGQQRLARQEMVARSAGIDFASLGQDYLRRARSELECPGRFLDKMPLNYLYCGLIRLALPRAKIIHVTRHPMAACFAMYKALFQNGYPFSYDLGDIARYYVGYRRLMDHWEALMPGAIHTVSYEALIADQIGESRKLLAFCGLEWQEACARPELNRAASTTASAVQVRQPVYASSISQWQHYEGQLSGLKADLVAAGITV